MRTFLSCSVQNVKAPFAVNGSACEIHAIGKHPVSSSPYNPLDESHTHLFNSGLYNGKFEFIEAHV